jgi:hypothetical protein
MRTPTLFTTGYQYQQSLLESRKKGSKNGKRNGKGQRKERYADLFSNGRAEAKNTDCNNTVVHRYFQRPREDKNLFAQIQLNRQTDVPLQ